MKRDWKVIFPFEGRRRQKMKDIYSVYQQKLTTPEKAVENIQKMQRIIRAWSFQPACAFG